MFLPELPLIITVLGCMALTVNQALGVPTLLVISIIVTPAMLYVPGLRINVSPGLMELILLVMESPGLA